MNRGRVLVVDDNSENLKVITNILKSRDFKVNALKNPLDVLSTLEEVEFDLIILDILMPERSGFELMQEIKEFNSYIPVIFLSAIDEVDNKVKAFELGGVDYITKPFKELELISRVKTHIELSSFRKHLNLKVQEETKRRVEQERILIQQSKMAQMGEMVGVIAHQWKQPLSIIDILASSLDSQSDLERVKSRLLDTVDNMISTMDIFLKFFSSNKLRGRFKLSKAIERVKKILAYDIKHFSVEIEDFTDSIEIEAVESEVEQLLLNLCSNSIDIIKAKNIQNGKIKIFAKESNLSTIFGVSDNLGGVSTDIINRVFEPYVSTKSLESRGVGLYMCKLIVRDSLKGDISVKNSKEGATFEVAIPKS